MRFHTSTALCLPIILALGLPTFLWANCYNNEDNTEPKRNFEVCFDSSCIVDTLIWECASTSWVGARFVSGFEVSCKTQVSGEGYDTSTKASECEYYLGEFELSERLLKYFSCNALNAGESGCSWYQQQ